MRCPREVTPHLSPIINVALQHIRYDPNYSYGDDEDGDDDVDMDGEEDEEVTLGAGTAITRVGVGGRVWGGGDGDGSCLFYRLMYRYLMYYSRCFVRNR